MYDSTLAGKVKDLRGRIIGEYEVLRTALKIVGEDGRLRTFIAAYEHKLRRFDELYDRFQELMNLSDEQLTQKLNRTRFLESIRYNVPTTSVIEQTLELFIVGKRFQRRTNGIKYTGLEFLVTPLGVLVVYEESYTPPIYDANYSRTVVPGIYVGDLGVTSELFERIGINYVPKENQHDISELLKGMGYKDPIWFWGPIGPLGDGSWYGPEPIKKREKKAVAKSRKKVGSLEEQVEEILKKLEV